MKEYRVEDEISLKILITALLESWKTLLSIVLVAVILSGIYNFVLAKPIYETKSELFMTLPEEKITEVGIYRYPSNNPRDYFDLITNSEIVNATIEAYNLNVDKEAFIQRLSITQENESNIVSITLRGENPEEIAKALDSHVEKYKYYLGYQFKEDAIRQFITEARVTISLKENQLVKTNEKLLNVKNRLKEISPTIPLQKAITANPELAAKYARDNNLSVSELSNQLLVEEVINENYLDVEKNVDNLEIEINDLEIEISALNEQLERLYSEKKLLEQSSVFKESQSDFLSVLSLPIKTATLANVPTTKIGPKRTLNIIMSIVLSGMLGIIIISFKTYWKNN